MQSFLVPRCNSKTKIAENDLNYYGDATDGACYELNNSLIVAVKEGRTFSQSPTTPNDASLNMFASPSLLIAIIFFEAEHPAICWLAPDIPTVIYMSGVTVLPVKPI